jgi:hypothetical protein
MTCFILLTFIIIRSVYSLFKKVLQWYPLYNSPLLFPQTLLLKSFHWVLLCFFLHRCIVFQYYPLYIILFSSPSNPSNSPTPSNMLIYIIMILFVYVYLSDLSSIYDRKHLTFVFLNLTYVTSNGELHFYPFTLKKHNFFLLYGWKRFHYVYAHTCISHFINTSINCWESRLFLWLGYCE